MQAAKEFLHSFAEQILFDMKEAGGRLTPGVAIEIAARCVAFNNMYECFCNMHEFYSDIHEKAQHDSGMSDDGLSMGMGNPRRRPGRSMGG